MSNIFSYFVVGRPRPEYGLPVAILYEIVGMSNIISCFVVGRPKPEYGLPVAVILTYVRKGAALETGS